MSGNSAAGDSAFGDYLLDGDACDEMFADRGVPHDHARELVDALEALGRERLIAAGDRRDAIFMQQGIASSAARREAICRRPSP